MRTFKFFLNNWALQQLHPYLQCPVFIPAWVACLYVEIILSPPGLVWPGTVSSGSATESGPVELPAGLVNHATHILLKVTAPG